MSRKFLTPIVLPADPAVAMEAATKQYVDNRPAGGSGAWKDPVRCASPPNFNFNFITGLTVVDGVQTVAGDRVLLTGQATPMFNGIYIASTGSWARATDADTGVKMLGATVMVLEGTVNADTVWTCTNNAPIKLYPTDGTPYSNIAFAPVAGTNEVWIGTDDPISYQSSIELWYDTDEPNVTDPAPRHGGSWRRTAAATSASGTLTSVTWDTETADTDSYLAIPNTTVTIPAGLDGIYVVSFGIYTGSEQGEAFLSVSSLGQPVTGRANPRDAWASAHYSGPLTVGSTILAQVWQGSGAAQPMVGAYLNVYRVGS